MKRTFLLYIFTFSISFFSCTEKVDIELDSTYERVVVEGNLTNEYKNHQVKISKSADYFANKPAEPITGADVSITDGTLIFELTEVDPGLYETEEMGGIPGKTYTLNIAIDAKKYSASDYMHTCPPIDSIGFKRFKMDSNYIALVIFAQEPAEETNYYAWRAYRNDTLVTDTLNEIFISDDTFINGNYINGTEVQYIKAKKDDLITLEMLSITKPYYDFITKIMLETDWDGGPFDGPPANFYGNISNEALGFFAVYSVERKTAIISEP